MDAEWFKNLATAVQVNGEWRAADPERVQTKARHTVMEAIPRLMQAALDAQEIFNLYRGDRGEVRVLPLREGKEGSHSGFVILCGKVQLRLEQSGIHLQETLAWLDGYRREERLIHIFSAVSDPFGGVTWLMDQSIPTTPELIIKQLYRDAREAHERWEKGTL